MPWIASQSKCRTLVKDGQVDISFRNGNSLEPVSWIMTKPNCKEQATVFWFVDEKFTITTANIVFFGISKAICNFLTGVLADAVSLSLPAFPHILAVCRRKLGSLLLAQALSTLDSALEINWLVPILT